MDKSRSSFYAHARARVFRSSLTGKKWLEDNGLSQLYPLLQENGFERLDDFAHVTEEDLREIPGMKPGWKKRFLRAQDQRAGLSAPPLIGRNVACRPGRDLYAGGGCQTGQHRRRHGRKH